MISTERLVAWAHAEGLSAEETTLRECEQAAVAYVNEPGGRYFGAESSITETHVWRGAPVIQLGNEPALDGDGASTLVLEQWTGTAWETVSSDYYFVAGRLVYLTDWRASAGFTTHLRATYTGGYTVDAGDADVWNAPADIQQAVRMLALHWYVNREAAVAGTISTEVALGVRMILAKYG